MKVGSLLAWGLPLGLGAAFVAWPHEANAAVTLDPSNPWANFTQVGNQTAQPALGLLTLDDEDGFDVVFFHGSDPDAVPGADLDLVVSFQIGWTSLNNADTGVRFVINDGDTRSAIFACVEVAGFRGIGIAGPGSASDPGTYLAFVARDWGMPTTLRLRRWANGDAEIIEVNGVAPSPRAMVNRDLLAGRTRAGATIEFGCASPRAGALVGITQLYSERPASAVNPGIVGPTLVMNKTVFPQLDLSDVILSWAASCSEGASDYGIYEGTIGAWSSHTSVDCNDGGVPLTEQITPAAGSRYYLVVPQSTQTEGSYGQRRDSPPLTFTERPVGAAQCIAVQTVTPCP